MGSVAGAGVGGGTGEGVTTRTGLDVRGEAAGTFGVNSGVGVGSGPAHATPMVDSNANSTMARCRVTSNTPTLSQQPPEYGSQPITLEHIIFAARQGVNLQTIRQNGAPGISAEPESVEDRTVS